MSIQLKSEELLEATYGASLDASDETSTAAKNRVSPWTPIVMLVATLASGLFAMYFFPTWQDNNSPKSKAKQVSHWESAMAWLGIDTDFRRDHKAFMEDLKNNHKPNNSAWENSWDH